MAFILCLETATPVCSAALTRDGEMIGLRESMEGNMHASSLTVFIDQLMQDSGMSLTDLDAVAVSKGPGSYTGLRVGVSTAKGLCYALNIPLIAINTLEIMAEGFHEKQHEMLGEYREFNLVPMLDARRMEVFCAEFNENVEQMHDTQARIIDQDSFKEVAAHRPTFFFGPGASKCKGVITIAKAVFIENFTCSAAYMMKTAEKKFGDSEFENLAYFEPYYLKDFVGTTPRKM